jgi:hypothetical protein
MNSENLQKQINERCSCFYKSLTDVINSQVISQGASDTQSLLCSPLPQGHPSVAYLWEDCNKFGKMTSYRIFKCDRILRITAMNAK